MKKIIAVLSNSAKSLKNYWWRKDGEFCVQYEG
jgi:hypothetical protein